MSIVRYWDGVHYMLRMRTKFHCSPLKSEIRKISRQKLVTRDINQPINDPYSHSYEPNAKTFAGG